VSTTVAGATGASAPRRTTSRRRARGVVAQTKVELALTLRRGESLLVSMLIPLGVLVFFSTRSAASRTRSTSSCPECWRSR
jgi:hypothetical protein